MEIFSLVTRLPSGGCSMGSGSGGLVSSAPSELASFLDAALACSTACFNSSLTFSFLTAGADEEDALRKSGRYFRGIMSL